MVFYASGKPHPLASSVNECMHTISSLQPHLWDIRMSTNLLLADIRKAFHQIGVKEEDRDAFRFLFNMNGNSNFDLQESPLVLKQAPSSLVPHCNTTTINNHQC